MTRELLPATIQIFVLDNNQKEEIRNKLTIALTRLGSAGNELDEYIENGMDSRLSDLSDTIDIYSLETIKVEG